MADLEALHTGIMKLGMFELPCYVLNNEKRVFSQREVVKLISGGRESGGLTNYLKARSVEPYLPPKFRGEIKDNVLIFKAGSTTIHGIEANDVVDICKAYLTARQNGSLHPQQAKLAEQAEMFITACAKTGIDAVVDEATGYQYFRKVNDLQEKLNAYLQEEYREWTLTFPREFFMQLYKLEGKTPPMPLQKYPKRFGRYVMHYIYDTLDPDVADFLRENNPEPGGNRHHHQLFNDFGYDNLSSHLMSVIGIMKASTTMGKFKENIAIAFPNARTTRRGRLLEKRQLKIKEEETTNQQLSMFDYISTVNTPSKEEKVKDTNNDKLSDFNQKLKKGLDYNPKEKEE
ncbi:MAG: hypothetical protein KDD41_02565 [Flavobacteriales bacterium]|nr:hypothetical protein [Flavobacteriales bacterium]